MGVEEQSLTIDELRREMSGYFVDAYGNDENANYFFDCIRQAERERIIAELEQGKRTLVFGPDKVLVDNIIKLINKGETK